MAANAQTIAIYSRKSKFTGKGESIGNQAEMCREYIRLHHGDTAAEKALVFEDEGFSGGNLNRPAFRRMMEAARKHQLRAIIVYRLDRISRNISDFSGLIQELSRLGVDFVSIREQFDTGSPMGRAMMYISSVFSQLERETIAERIRDNMYELAKTGRWLGGTTPTGYASESVQTVTVDGKNKKACRLKLIPEEAEIVRTIYGIFRETDSLTMTDAELLRRKIVTKTGKNYTRFSIKAILQNPVYMMADEDAWNWFREQGVEVFSPREAFDGRYGIIAYNRTDQEKGRTTVCRPVQEWIICVGQHEGIIPGKIWAAVQDALERNKSKGFRKARSNEALLTGLLYCACGSRMYPKISKRLTPEGESVYTYVCKMKERSQRANCSSKNLSGNLLDAAVVEEIRKLDEDTAIFREQLEKSKQFYTGSRGNCETRLAGLQKEKADLQKKIAGLVDALALLSGSSAKGPVISRIEALNAESDALELRLRELEGMTGQSILSDSEFDVLKDLLSTFRTAIDLMTLEQKRAAVRTLIRKVVWDGEHVHMILFGAEGAPAYPNIRSDRQSFDEESGDGETHLCEDSK